MDLSTVAGRAAAIAVAGSVLMWFLREKWAQNALERNKWLTRSAVIACVALGAAIADWLPDRTLTLAAWLPVFVASLPGTEFSYQWLVKAIGGWADAKGVPPKLPIIGAGCLFLVLLLVAPMPAQAVDLAPSGISATALLANGGTQKLTVSASWPVGHVNAGGAEVNLFLDAMLVEGGLGAGVSAPVTDLLQAAHLLSAIELAPPLGDLAALVRVGVCGLHSHSDWSGGLYGMIVLKELTW